MMLTVTRIKREGKRFAVHFAGGVLAHLDETAVEQGGVELGAELEEQELRRLAIQSARRLARERALYAIGRKEYCREGLIGMLTRTDCPRAAAEAVADEMEELGFLNDERYAGMLAGYLYRDKHYGRRRVIMELTNKGLARHTALAAAEAEQPVPGEALDALLEDWPDRELTTPEGLRRTMNSFMRKGYETGDIRAAINRRRERAE